jgi:hypothetical protein
VATFIQLVNDVERESGIINKPQRLTTVVGANGRQEKIVHWTATAWEDIQRERRDWTFLRTQFDEALTVGQATYTAAQLGITNFGGWVSEADNHRPFTIYDPAIGRGDETRLHPVQHRAWLDAFDIGVHDATRPNTISIGFDRTLNLGPKPDKSYVLRGWYRRKIQTLVADSDTPYLDEQYHNAIVYRALMLLAEHDEAGIAIGTAQKKAGIIHSQMLSEFLDPVHT